jgi:dienelactone hydrolase
MSTKLYVAAALAAGVLVAGAPAVLALDPAVESKNFSKTQERSTIFNTPQYQALLRQVGLQNRAASVAIQAADPERNFSTHVCASGEDGCAGDVRLYDWGPKGYGEVKPVLFTARNGATLSGRVWATKAGPAKRPAIVITNGSVQADEQMYWFVAQTLAKAGYVVLTFDPQGQGQSDENGEGADQNEGSPAQTDGRPFFDGTEDAIDFMLSSPSHPYEPVPSCNSGTSHAPKQDRRVKAGLDAPYNPFWARLDAGRLGIAGHSYGAAGVSYIAQWDPRVKAVVAWDNLSGTDPNAPFMGGGPVEQPCPGDPAARKVAPITKPALGMSADYGLPATPNKSDPDPLAKTSRSIAYSKAGVDTGELIIRGGSHLDFSWIPNSAFSGSLRGADMINWYTTAWFDKYVKGDCTADRRLLTDRWRHDGDEAAIDPDHDGNMFSFYYRSRLAFHLADGTMYDNENLRDATGLRSSDGYSGTYSYLPIDTSPDTANTDFGTCRRPPPPPCVDRRKFTFRLHHAPGARVVKVEVFVNGKLRLVRRGHALRSVTVSRPPRKVFHLRVVSTQSSGSKLVSRRTYRGCGKGRPTTRAHHARKVRALGESR